MPIEIRELHIKINVTPEKDKPQKDSNTSDGILQEVVEAVMETIARKKER
ncbi:DUF5908 family protein [Belliella kenyensis]|uniref:DUF5908 family protein n=1 Tax=Belliella kenyensis TaxID=1472724 RepID=A0ABV8EM35_9BACT|nr:DUF5908 family protein [Belliella kenyensis]MCH7400371.1 DUF5908 family protein [Belliella kenyensis]MDN3604611.1 DUF5908 family protein [Belliella kenyensis]